MINPKVMDAGVGIINAGMLEGTRSRARRFRKRQREYSQAFEIIMHELSIATNLVELVAQHLPAGGAKVQNVRLRIGALSCVHADALRFSFELVTAGTQLEGAVLEIISVPVSIYCRACDSIETIEGIQSFRCPRCETPSADIRSGQELDLESIELIEEEAEHILH